MKSLTLSLLILICCGLAQPPVWCTTPTPEEEGEQEESTDEEEETEGEQEEQEEVAAGSEGQEEAGEPTTAKPTEAQQIKADNELLKAARLTNPANANKLLESGNDDGVVPNINTQGMSGNTPLMWAIDEDCYLTALLLLSYNPDFTKQNKDGDTALIIAARKGSSTLIQDFFNPELTQENKTILASLNLPNNAGNTALMEAIKNAKPGFGGLTGAHTEIALTLIEAGADTKIKNNAGQTALDIAKSPEVNNSKIIERLSRFDKALEKAGQITTDAKNNAKAIMKNATERVK